LHKNLFVTSLTHGKLLAIFINSFREKLMTVPRKKTKIDINKEMKADIAAQIDKVNS
jgi:hypothetical protein